MNRYYEVPPTAGLPLTWRDWWPRRGNFAQATSQLLGLPPLQLTCSGTAALIVTLQTLAEISHRRVVIIPAYTCPLVALAIAHCGLIIRLCDLKPEHFDLDLHHLENLLDKDVLAVIPTHLGGRVADIKSVQEIAKPLGVYVIEDAAQALGAAQNGMSVGLNGDVGFFSLAVGKGLSIFEGGLLLSRNPVLQSALQATYQQLIHSDAHWECQRLVQLLGYTAFYHPYGLYAVYGQPLRRSLAQGQLIEAVGDDFDADIPLHTVGAWRQSIGCQALARLPDFLLKTKQQALRRIKRLAQIAGLIVLTDNLQGAEGVWPFLMVLLPNEARRDAALVQLWHKGLGVTRLFIHTLPDYHYLQTIVPLTDVPNSRNFAARLLTISNSLWLDNERFERICMVLETA